MPPSDPPLPDNPLPPCPSSPNCVRRAEAFDADPDVLFGAVQAALAALGPVEMHVQPSDRSVHAVFRVALLFKDDVEVAIRANGATHDTSALYVRSASRVGKSDLGVNRRRVTRFLQRLQEQL